MLITNCLSNINIFKISTSTNSGLEIRWSLLWTAENITSNHDKTISLYRLFSLENFIIVLVMWTRFGSLQETYAHQTDRFVDEVKLLQANPHYTYVRYPESRETTVLVKYLIPIERPVNFSVFCHDSGTCKEFPSLDWRIKWECSSKQSN